MPVDVNQLWITYEIPIRIFLIILGGFITARTLRWLLRRSVTDDSPDTRAFSTTINFLQNGVRFSVIIIATLAIVYTIPALRTLALSLTAGAGIIAAIIAFASQAALANIVGGIFIVIFRPFRVGDRIKVGADHEGIVETITLRHTVIQDWEHRRIIIPNSVVSTETIINSDIGNEQISKFLEIPISYQANLDQACHIIREEVMKHPLYKDVRTPTDIEAGEPPVNMRFIRYLDSGLMLRVYIWGEPGETFVMSCDLRKTIKDAFEREKVPMAIPYIRLVDQPI